MSVELVVPTLGESISEAIIGKWHKKTGDSVKADEAVVVLETDKVTVDVAAPASGTMESIKFKEGDKVKVGEVLGTISAGAGATTSAANASKVESTRESSTPKVESTREPSTPPPSKEVSAQQPVKATPVARNIMDEKEIDPSKVKGTGPGGRIHKDDVLAHGGAAQPQAAKSTPPPAPSGPRAKADREERVRMTPLRKRVAERLLSAQSTAAILTTFNEVDMSAVMTLRKQYQDAFVKKHGVKLGFMSFFVRAAIEALKTFPAVNAEIEGEDVVFKHYYDIGVAVSGSRGLVVPVVRDADLLSMAELEKTIAAYGEKAKNGKLTLDELMGGTFTISNGGTFGSMLSTPILNPPQTGILGMHNIVERPVARNGEVVIRPVMYLALSYDHRLIDGREAVQFLVRIKDCIEDPQRLLLEI